jgi:hypothetical protein
MMQTTSKNSYGFRNADILAGNNPQEISQALFDQAIFKANGQSTLDAMSLAQEALVYANRANLSIRPNIHRFLAMLNFEIGKYHNARLHCWYGLQVLNFRHKNYFEEKEYFETLMGMADAARKGVAEPAQDYKLSA